MTLQQILDHANTVKLLAEIGDNRLLASDGPAGNQRPDLTKAEGLRFDRSAYVLACWILDTCDPAKLPNDS